MLRIFLMASDAAMLTLAFVCAYFLRFTLDFSLVTDVGGDGNFYSSVVYALIPTWLVVFLLSGLYDEHNLLGGTREYSLVFSAVSAGMLVVVLATFLNPAFIIARGWVVFSWLFAFGLVVGARFGVRRVVYALRNRGLFVSPALIIGTNSEARALAEQLVSWRTSGLQVLGFVGHQRKGRERLYRNLYVIGDLCDVDALVEEYGVEELVVATSALSRPELVDLFRRYLTNDKVQLRLSSGLFEIMTTGLSIKEIAYVPLVNIHPVRLTGIDRVMKAALDTIVAVTAVIVLAPVYVTIAVAVKLDSPGPIFHRRRVLGQGGVAFNCFKFRSMRVDGDAILAAQPELVAALARDHKLRNDPRVTRLGGFLRRTSLDELPQFFNVLLGQMSVVGPRMIAPAEHERYGQWDVNLLTVKPGITGLWQVSGRSDISYERRVQLDMYYIRNWTIWFDFQILLQTIPAVLKRRGAY
jgi:exopolysaccharide biosynthesis polyprenyl glycosylphosphotransferase